MPDKKRRKLTAVAPQLLGFPARFRYALEIRQREEPDLSQNDWARRCQLDPGNFSRLKREEDGSTISANTLLLVAEGLRCSPAWLLTGVEPSGLAGSEHAAETPKPPSVVRVRTG